MRGALRILFLALMLPLCSGLAGCGTLLRTVVDPLVNKEFPPVSIDAQRAQAVREAQQTLDNVRDPAILVTVDNPTVSDIFSGLVRDVPNQELTVVNARVGMTDQALHFWIDVKGRINDPGLDFEATLDAEAIVSTGTDQSTQLPIAIVQPTLNSARLTNLKLDRWSFASRPIADAINALIARYRDNIRGAIKPLTWPIDVSKTGLSTTPTQVALPGGRTVVVPGVSVGTTAVLIDTDGLHLLADANLVAATARAAAGDGDFAAYRQAFWTRAGTVAPTVAHSAPGIYLADGFLDKVLDPAFPPLPYADLQSNALDDLNTSLARLRPNADAAPDVIAIGAYVSPAIVTSELQSVLTQGIKDWSNPKNALPGDKGWAALQVGVPSVTLSEQSVVVTSDVKGTVPNTAIEFSGKVSLAGILSTNEVGLYYRIAMAGISLESVRHTGSVINVTPFIGSINRFLDQMVPYLNSLTMNTPLSIAVQALAPVALPSQSGMCQ